MNFLNEIEGLSGEALAAAVLQYLVTRSFELRTVFLEQISDRFLDRPVIERADGFFFTKEAATRSSEEERGYLDLMIESPTAVIGVELKIWAPMQEGQPRKYVETVQNRARELSQSRGSRNVAPYVLLIGPKIRESEITCHDGFTSDCRFLSWQDMLSGMKARHNEIDDVSRLLIVSLEQFIESRCGWINNYGDSVRKAIRSFPDYGSEAQHEIVRKLWRLFPNPSPRLGCGKDWAGYYFLRGLGKAEGWFGFIPRNRFEKDDLKSAFVIATPFELIDLPPFTSKVILDTNDVFLGRGVDCHAYSVDLVDALRSENNWTPVIQSILDSARVHDYDTTALSVAADK